MTWEDALKIISATIISAGAGGAIIFSLSSWLGKVWANRILENERHLLATDLETAKRDLDGVVSENGK